MREGPVQWSEGRGTVPADDWVAAARRPPSDRPAGLQEPARAVPRRRARLRYDLPPAPGRSRPDVGGAPHREAGHRPARRHARAPGRDHLHRLRDVAAAARGCDLGHRGVLPAPALRAREPRPRGRLRGPLRPARRAPARGVGWGAPCPGPGGPPPLLRLHDVKLPGRRVRTLTMGDGEQDVMLLHGLGASKSSFFETAAALAPRYRVHAIDFPGFGWSSKPAYAPYSARWFADTVVEVMDQLGVERAHVVGNSMGGRVAIEVGLRRPDRVSALGLLCPAVAFIKRAWHPLVRLARPEFGLLPHRYPRRAVAGQLTSMFFDRDALDPLVGDIVVDEFQRIYGSAGARFAFLCAARNISLDAPWGKSGFYARLADLEAPALFVWGSHDKLIPAGFKRHVAEWLPTAEQVVLDRCGHVPQVEHPETTNALLQDFFGRIDSTGRRFVPRRARLAA